MIFVVLNIALAAFIIWTSMNVNTKNQGAESNMINVLLLEAASAIIVALVVVCIFYGPERIAILLDHLEMFLFATIFIEISSTFLSMGFSGKSKFRTFLKVVLILFAAFISFTKIHMSDYTTFSMKSDLVFSGQLGKTFPLTWLQLYVLLYVFFCPLFGLVILLLNAENTNSRLTVQRAIFSLGSIIFGYTGFAMIFTISNMLPMVRSLIVFILTVFSVMILNTVISEKIYDFGMMVSSLFSMLVKYFIPAAIGAILYVGFRPLHDENYNLYVLVVFAGIFGVMILGRLLSSLVGRFFTLRSSLYENQFEKDLASIDYENELTDISQEFFKAFQNNTQITAMTVLMDNGNNELSTSYSSDGRNVTLEHNAKVREIITNNELYIIFRDELETNYLLQEVKSDLYHIFNESESECIIALHEGHHILGLLLLAEKRTGSAFDQYDKKVFDKFYSYFFVFGYYLKNIANASVVGTVNREIRMSSQIITSIQENMDVIKNPKIDIGYLMVPAHNIGGEFVDMIRLNDTSHIIVTGALSGKGISASMSMVILKSIIRTFLSDTHDFKKLIQKVNSFIRFNLPKGTYFSGLFCLMDFSTDTMYYVNCGIPAMLMYSKTYNNVIEVQGKGYVLGFVKDITPLIKVKQMKLASGDMITISTNGLINSHSLRGEQFGKERIKQTMLDNYTYPASRIARFSFDNLQNFMSKELEEDITVLVLRYFGKDGAENIVESDSSSEHIVDHSESFDADALLADVMDESSIIEKNSSTVVQDMTVEASDTENVDIEKLNAEASSVYESPVEEETVVEPPVEEEVPDFGADFDAVSEETPVETEVQSISEEPVVSEDAPVKADDDFSIDSVFDDDMFNGDFSNPNAGISIEDIVDTDIFDDKNS